LSTEIEPEPMTQADGEPGTEPGPAAPVRERPLKKRRSRLKKFLLALLAAFLLLILLLLLFLWLILGRQEQIHDAITPRPADAKGQTFLLIGTDRRSLVQTTGKNAEAEAFEPGAQRSDMLMLFHITDDRSRVYGVSIPRDTWIDIPGHGKAKVNAAYSFGGAKLAVQTVQELTGVHIDHLAVVDWTGFQQLTDTLGGVDVFIPKTTTDLYRKVQWTQGFHHLNGSQALMYVGQRAGLPNGDFDRIKRQQNFLRQISAKTLASRNVTKPKLLKDLLDQFVSNVSVDDKLDPIEMFKLAWSLRGFDTQYMSFFTVPNQGTGRAGDQSIVVYDQKRADQMWKLFKDEDYAKMQKRFGELELGGSVS